MQTIAATNASLVTRCRGWLDAIPYSVIALIARLATFFVFWRSGHVKLDDWAGTLTLFEEEYKVPLIPPHIAAYMATAMELGGSSLVLVGLGTRVVTLMLLGMVTVIQLLVYPSAWPTHIQWLAFMLILVARGPGKISLDALLCRWIKPAPAL
jgi:putative oxidoreductase